jgi:hypothetical protein
MLAPRTITERPSGLPHLIELVVGGVLDLMIQSIEGLRELVMSSARGRARDAGRARLDA